MTAMEDHVSTEAAPKPTLPVALVTTVLNEAATLDSFLATFERQTAMPAEIVVVDGGSTDGTLDVLRRWQERLPGLDVIVSAGANISAGRNVAIRAATADVIAVTDAGTVLSHDWLELITAPLIDPTTGADVVAGFSEPGGDGRFQRILATVITPTLPEVDPATFLPSSRSVAFRRSAWEAAGGYPEWLTHCEDLVFDLAARDAGMTQVFEPNAVASWEARPSLKAFFKQYYRYARGDGQAGLWPKRHAVRYATYIGAPVSLAFAGRHRVTRVGLVAAACLYMKRYWGRVLRSTNLSDAERPLGLALAPVVMFVGDVAKMIGYPVGLIQRREVLSRAVRFAQGSGRTGNEEGDLG